MSEERGPGYEYFLSPELPPTGAPPGANPSWALSPDTFHRTPVPTGYPMPRWLVAVMGVVGGLITVSLIAALAVPMFLDQRASSQWKSTAIALPNRFQDAPRTSSPTLAQLGGAVGQGFGKSLVGLYQKSPTDLVLIIAAKPEKAMNASDQEKARGGFVKGFTSAGRGVDLTLEQEDEAGKLGGWLGCGTAGRAEVCVATDAGSLVAVVMGPGVPNPVDTARAARAATITRK